MNRSRSEATAEGRGTMWKRDKTEDKQEKQTNRNNKCFWAEGRLWMRVSCFWSRSRP